MTAREKVAAAVRGIIHEWAAGMLDCGDLADAAIAAHLDALKADGYVIAPARLIEDLTDPDPCQWDHNHSCQAHGHFYIDQGELCPVEEAKRLIAAAEAQR